MRPHFRVHGRRHQHRLSGRQQHRGSEIVGKAVGELGHQVGGGRRDDDEVGLASQPDMADILLVLAVEQIGEDMVGGQRADRQRRDETLRGLGHDGAHRGAALAQPADQVERFVGGDAAADDQENALVGKGHLRWRGVRQQPSTALGNVDFGGAIFRLDATCRAHGWSRDRRWRVPLVLPAAASAMIVRASCSMDTPRSAARLRNSRFTFSSRFLIVSVAMPSLPSRR